MVDMIKKADYCLWCEDPYSPSADRHPNGQQEHVILPTECEECRGLGIVPNFQDGEAGPYQETCPKCKGRKTRWVDDSDPAAALAEVMDGTPLYGPSPLRAEYSKLASKIATMPRKHDSDYPLWQGPCGEGPLGGVTQSMLVRFLSCRERFRLKYVCGLEAHPKWQPSFGYGNMWHICEEAHAKNGVWAPAAITYFNEQLRLYPLQREEIIKWFNVCCVQFPEYVKFWLSHPDVLNRTPLMQEQVFDVLYTLPSGRVVRLRGKFDSVDLIDGGIYLQENKTKGDVDRSKIERQLKFDLQTMMYLIAFQTDRALDTRWHERPGFSAAAGKDLMGVRYNVVKRDCPIKQHVGRQLKAGWKDGETTEHWMERLRTEYYGAAPEEYFLRIRSEVSANDIGVFRETCLDPLLETLCYWYYCTTNQPRELVFQDGKQLDLSWPFWHYRTPFGVYSALEEGGATEYDAYMESGSEVGLRRVETLFGELQ